MSGSTGRCRTPASGWGSSASSPGSPASITCARRSRTPARSTGCTREGPLPVIKVGMVSLGCPKNLVDSEVMLGTLRHRGYDLTADPSEADVIVVNTCTFIEAARRESIETLLEMAGHKKTGRCRRLVVAGCMVQQSHDELRKALPEIDALVGLNDIERIAEACALEAR